EISEPGKCRSADARNRAREENECRRRYRDRSRFRPARRSSAERDGRNEINQRQSNRISAGVLPTEEVFRSRNPEPGKRIARGRDQNLRHDRSAESDSRTFWRPLCRNPDWIQIFRRQARQIRAGAPAGNSQTISAAFRRRNSRSAIEVFFVLRFWERGKLRLQRRGFRARQRWQCRRDYVLRDGRLCEVP